MHEYHMVERVVRQAIAVAQENGAARIIAITLVAGKKAGIDPECVRLHFSQVVAGTIAQSAALTIKDAPGEGGAEFYIEDIEVEAKG